MNRQHQAQIESMIFALASLRQSAEALRDEERAYYERAPIMGMLESKDEALDGAAEHMGRAIELLNGMIHDA